MSSSELLAIDFRVPADQSELAQHIGIDEGLLAMAIQPDKRKSFFRKHHIAKRGKHHRGEYRVVWEAESYASGQDRLPKTVRFCETDLMTVHKDSFQVQRLEVVNTGRRRRWSVAEKLRIVEESFQGHRQVSATACRHDISPSLLFSWRKAFRRGRDEVIGFAPALIVPDEEAPLGAAAAVGRMEIVTVTGQRIMVGADVDVLALARVVAALEAR